METSNQNWSASKYSSNAAFVPVMTSAVVSLLAPQHGERIMDLGCGDGILTKHLASAVIGNTSNGQIVALDGSPALVEACNAHMREGTPDSLFQNGQVVVEVADGQQLEASKWKGHDFDAVFSNAALHWMSQDPVAVVRGVYSTLRKGGRFVAEFGGHLNVLSVHSHIMSSLKRRGVKAKSPWYFPTTEDYSKILIENGFTIEKIEIQPRQTPLTTDVAGWIDTFGAPFLASVREAYPETAETVWKETIDEVVENLRPFICDANGKWTLDYVRLRFKAIKH